VDASALSAFGCENRLPHPATRVGDWKIFRSRRRIASLYWAAIGTLIALGCISRVQAETLQDIEGLSVKVDYHVQFTTPVDQTHRIGTADVAIHFYISSKGNIFLYTGKASIYSGGEETDVGGRRRVVAPDQAGEQQFGQLDAWTMMNGHLTQIIKFIHGYAVTTIAIDPSRLTCTFDRQYQPDPQTGTIVSNTSGRPVQIESYKVTSYSCDVKKGNVFASNSEQ